MKGTLLRVGPDAWRLWVDLGPDPVTGRRRRISRTLRGTPEQVAAQRAQIVADIANGRHQEPAHVTWETFAAQWAELIAPTVRPATHYSYTQKAALVSRYIGDRRLADLTGPVLNGMYRQMVRDGYSAHTVTHAHRLVSRALKDAVRWGTLGRNPADNADPPRVQRTEMKVWSATEVREFLEATRGTRMWPLWRVAFATGMRRGEIAGMRWGYTNLAAGTIDIVATRVLVAGQVEASQPKTAAGRRRIAIDPDTIAALTAHHQSQAADRAYFTWLEDWVWCWEDGRPWSPDWIGKQWRTDLAKTGMRPIRFHDIRHTWATLALETGVPAKVVADRLGHAGIAITLDTYTHHVPELDRKAADQVARLIS